MKKEKILKPRYMKILTKQIQDAVVDMMSKVKRVDKGRSHHYVRVSDEKFLAGVTEVSSAAGYKEAKVWMPAWGSKSAVAELGYYDKYEGETHKEELARAEKILTEVKGMTLEQYLERLQEAKGGFARTSGKAKDIGTAGHEFLETWCKARIRKEKEPEIPKFGEYIEKGIKEFIAWADKEVDEFVLAEARVAMPVTPYEFAGTLDILAIMRNGKAGVLDFKFADNQSITWPLQLVAYLKTFLPYGIDVSERYVLRFPKSEYLKEWDKKSRMYKRIPNKFEVIRYDPKYINFDFETFIAYRAADKWVNSNIKN